MAAKLSRLIHKIAIQLHLVAESRTISSSRARRPIRKLLDILWYISILVQYSIRFFIIFSFYCNFCSTLAHSKTEWTSIAGSCQHSSRDVHSIRLKISTLRITFHVRNFVESLTSLKMASLCLVHWANLPSLVYLFLCHIYLLLYFYIFPCMCVPESQLWNYQAIFYNSFPI